jgi:PAS domain S-box-containing protein
VLRSGYQASDAETTETRLNPAKPIAPCQKPAKLYLLSFLLIVFTFLADSTMDSFLEQESLMEQLASPPRLVLLAIVVASVCYVIRIIVGNSSLKRSHALQVAAMESSIDGIAIFDAGSRLVYSNRAHTQLFGYETEQELVDRSWLSLHPEEEQERFLRQVLPALNRTGQWRGETVGMKKDGRMFPQEMSLTRLDNGGMIRVVRDISEKRKYQNELERKAQELTETNRELETFSYSLSHDMRSYITRVSSAAQLLLDGDVQPLNDSGRFMASSIQTAAEDMEQLIESIQVLASISRSEPRLEQVDLSETVREIAAGISLNDPERQVEFVIQPGIVATCDERLMKVALYNLLQNAWKYTGGAATPRVEFGSEDRDGRKLLFVRDNGVGFDVAQAERIFEPFQRLDNARDYPGTGVGLATVQRVIQLHRGEVWGVGKPGSEATFYFWLGE